MSVQLKSDLRSFLNNYRVEHRDDFLEIGDEISVIYDTTTYFALKNPQNKILMFNNLKNYKNFRLITNVLGSRQRILHATGTDNMEEFNRKFSRAINSDNRTGVDVNSYSAPFKKNILRGNEVDLSELPVPSHYTSDGSRAGIPGYITAGIVAVREMEDPEVINLGFTRIQPISKNRYAFDAGSHGHLWKYLNAAKNSDIEAELTVLIGVHPLFYLLAASFIDNEYEKAKNFMDFELSRGMLNDIYLPSETEIVLEAKFIPDETFEEGPFAEYTGYMGQDSTRYMAEVKAMMMRDNPIYYDIQPSNSSEHVNTFSLPRSSRVDSAIRQFMPQGTDFRIYWPHSGARFLSLGWVEPAEKNLANQLGISVMSFDPLWGKMIFVNTGKCELDLFSAIARLLNTKNKINNCVSIIEDMFVISSDFTAAPEGNVGKVIFVSNSQDSKYTVDLKDGELYIVAELGTAVITHRRRKDHRINLIVGKDIDLSNSDQILWALATRVNPSNDFEMEDDRITIYADRTTPEIPQLDPDSVSRISKLIDE